MTTPLHERLKKFLQENGAESTDAEITEMASVLRNQYASEIEGTKSELDKPRPSTRGDGMQGARDANVINYEAGKQNLELQRGTAGIAGDMYERRIKGDINKHAALTDANTQSQLALMGGSFRQMQQDAFASKADSLQGNIGYYDRRDSKYVDVIKGDQALAQQGMNMDFIGKLVAGAALLAG